MRDEKELSSHSELFLTAAHRGESGKRNRIGVRDSLKRFGSRPGRVGTLLDLPVIPLDKGPEINTMVWLGIALFVVGALAWFVFKIAVGFAAILFVAGIVAIAWGAMKAKRAVSGTSGVGR